MITKIAVPDSIQRMSAYMDRVAKITDEINAMVTSLREDYPTKDYDTLEEEWGHIPTLAELWKSVEAWVVHVDKHALEDRKRFAAWLMERNKDFLAWCIDAEIGRQELYRVYLRDVYGQ